MLNKALPEGVDNFVKSCREQVIKDANLMYQEFHPGEVLSEEVITKILDDLTGFRQGVVRFRANTGMNTVFRFWSLVHFVVIRGTDNSNNS